jgi:AhpD family alkylhydroperoxidase
MSATPGGRSDGGTSRPEGRETTGGINPARIPPGGFKELGPINWAIAKIGARGIRAPKFHLFNVLGQHRLLFLAWLPFSGYLLYAGKLPRTDAELVILRVSHLRDCEYELQQHRRLARSRGVDVDLQAKIFEGADAEGLTGRQRVLITATDEFVITRSMSPETWSALSGMLSRAQLIEFCTLAGQYDALAATMATLKIPLDFPH